MSSIESVSNTPPALMPQPRRRPRWWLRALVLLAGVALMALGVIAYSVVSVDSAWRAAEAEADALDPRWRLAELEQDREVVPDALNAASVIILAHSKGKNIRVADAPDYDLIFDRPSPTAQLNAQQLRLIHSQLDRIPAALAEAHKLKDRPRGHFAVQFSDDWGSMSLAHHHDARAVADWLMHDAYLLAHEGRCDEALDACRAILNAGRCAGDDRCLITHLIRLRLQAMAVQTAERVLGQGKASEGSLVAFQELVAREIRETNWCDALKGERAGAHQLFENIRTGKVKSAKVRIYLLGNKANNFPDWMMDQFPTTVLKYYPEHLRTMTRMVEIAKLPLHEQTAKLAENKKLMEAGNSLFLMLLPRADIVFANEVASQASLRSMLAGLACERYRLKQKRWPKSLEELVEAKLLTAVPLDPIDGRPLRYRRDKDAIVVYSIGADEVDDKGHIERPLVGLSGKDFGFRLWSPPRRHGAPMPEVAIPETPAGEAP